MHITNYIIFKIKKRTTTNLLYTQTRVLSFPGLISVVWVNKQRTGAELYQNAHGVVNKEKIFCSHQCSPECSVSQFRTNIHRHVFRLSQDSSVWLGLTSREQLMSPECSKYQVLSYIILYILYMYLYMYIYTRTQKYLQPYILRNFHIHIEMLDIEYSYLYMYPYWALIETKSVYTLPVSSMLFFKVLLFFKIAQDVVQNILFG